MRILENKKMKVALLVIAFIFFFLSGVILPCQKCDISQKNCCSESSCQVSTKNEQKGDCSCEIRKWPESPSSPEVILPDYSKKSESILKPYEFEFAGESALAQQKDNNFHFLTLLSRDPPLYLLNSTFLI
jgi:hypothetical protein